MTSQQKANAILLFAIAAWLLIHGISADSPTAVILAVCVFVVGVGVIHET